MGDMKSLKAKVDNDRPDLLYDEANQWRSLSRELTGQLATFKGRIQASWNNWNSTAGYRYQEELWKRYHQLEELADVANENHQAWLQVASTVTRHKQNFDTLYQEWSALPEDQRTTTEADYVIRAMGMASDARLEADGYGRTIAKVDYYEPFPPVGEDRHGPGSDSSGSGPGGPGPSGRPGGSSPTSPGAPQPPGGVNPNDPGLPGPHPQAPELQASPPSGAAPAPTPAPAVPAPSSGGVGVNPGGPVIPPGGGVGPTSPGLTPKPPVAGTKPAFPGRTSQGGPPSVRSPGGIGPRPPQSTVRPVIGSRPGSSGMAPTGSRQPTPPGLNRPVIGARPGGATPSGSVARPPAIPGGTSAARPSAQPGRTSAAKPLIGKNGVIESGPRARPGVRFAKPYSGGATTNRAVISGARPVPAAASPGTRKPAKQTEDPETVHHNEGGDHVWEAERTTVPGVITGGDWSGAEHGPGALAEFHAEAVPNADERETVERLSQRDEPSSDPGTEAFWTGPKVVPGIVVAPKPQSSDGDW